MQIDIRSIRDPQVRRFYSAYWGQRRILYDFYTLLPEEQYDYRMVDRPERKSDTPRASLAHILYVQLVYFHSARTGKLAFTSLGVEHYWTMSKADLLAEMERIEQEMFAYLTSDAFDSNKPVDVFWGGQMNAVDVLYFLHEHDILHIGWNLAVMDHVNMPRFPSLIQYWGE